MDEACIAADQGVDCVNDATMTSPVPLCDGHQLQVALLIVPDILTAALRHAGSDLKPVPLPPEERSAVVAGARPKPVGAHMGGAHGPVVYFADTGVRIKIGTSTNLRKRLRSLSLQENDVVLLLQGGLMLERALHDTFKKERIDSTEWFAKSDRLMKFIQSKLADLGRPLSGAPHKQQKRATRSLGAAADGRRTPAEWATLAEPLYRKFVADHDGKPPTGRALQNALRGAYPALSVPGSDRWGRNLRADVEKLIGAST